MKTYFFTGLLQQCQVDKNAPQWLIDLRQQSKNWLSSLSVPTRKDEDWRFINLSSLTAGKYVTPQNPVDTLHVTSLPETKNSRLVFVNGVYSADLSNISALPAEIYVGNLNNLPDEYDAAKYFAQQPGTDAFTALNTAGGNEVAVVWVKKNVAVENTIHLVFLADGQKEASFVQPRVLAVAETGSNISLLEEYSGVGRILYQCRDRSFCC